MLIFVEEVVFVHMFNNMLPQDFGEIPLMSMDDSMNYLGILMLVAGTFGFAMRRREQESQ